MCFDQEVYTGIRISNLEQSGECKVIEFLFLYHWLSGMLCVRWYIPAFCASGSMSVNNSNNISAPSLLKTLACEIESPYGKRPYEKRPMLFRLCLQLWYGLDDFEHCVEVIWLKEKVKFMIRIYSHFEGEFLEDYERISLWIWLKTKLAIRITAALQEAGNSSWSWGTVRSTADVVVENGGLIFDDTQELRLLSYHTNFLFQVMHRHEQVKD
jgi:hypothetical protein